jgi:hypothetical protein
MGSRGSQYFIEKNRYEKLFRSDLKIADNKYFLVSAKRLFK